MVDVIQMLLRGFEIIWRTPAFRAMLVVEIVVCVFAGLCLALWIRRNKDDWHDGLDVAKDWMSDLKKWRK